MLAGELRKAAMRLVLGAVVAALGVCAFAGVALADWAPVESGPLNASGTDGLAGGGASVGGVTYFGWAETDEDDAAVISAQHVSIVSAGAITGEAPDPEAFTGANAASQLISAPRLFAVGARLYAVQELSGGNESVVLALEGSSWRQQGGVLEGSPSLAEGPSSGEPIAGFVNAGGRVQIDQFSGGSWSKLAEGAAPTAGRSIEGVQLLSHASTPIVSWITSETDPEDTDSLRDRVYADELSDAGLTPLSGGAELNDGSEGLEAGWTLVALGGTPYIGIGEAHEGETQIVDTRVLKLEETSFVQVAGTVREVPYYYQLEPGLAEYGGEPIAVTIGEDPVLHVLASSLSGGAWSSFGGPLGVPPLPEVDGAPYALTAFEDAAGTPYVALQQQKGEEFGKVNLYLEAYTSSGVDPLGSGSKGGGTQGPIVTEKILSETPSSTQTPTPTVLPAASAVLELVGSPKLSGGRALKLSSGIELYCPPSEGTCAGTVTLKLSPAKSKAKHAAERANVAKIKKAKAKAKAPKSVTAKLKVAAGAHRTIVLALTGAAAKAVLAARALDGSLKVSASGGNGVATTLSEKLALKAKAAKRGGAKGEHGKGRAGKPATQTARGLAR